MTCRFIGCAIVLTLPLVVTRAALAAEDDDFQIRVNAKLDSAKAEQIRAAERIRKDSAEQVEKLEGRLAEITAWTQAQFELGERGVIKTPTVMTPVLARWQEQREQDIFQFLQFAEKSGVAIESGRALNTLLTAVGPAAYQHQLTRQVNPDKGLPLYEPTALDQVDDNLLRQLVYKEKTLGSKRIGRFNGGPLDIEWPSILSEDRWKAHRAAIENARNQLLIELGSNAGLSPKTNAQIRNSVAALNEAFDTYRRDRIKRLAASSGVPAQELARLRAGQRHMKNLIATVYQIVEATSYQDIAPPDPFQGGNIEDFLAYLHRNNLQFERSTKATDRPGYYRMFDLMVRYYLDVKAMANLEQQLEYEIGKLKETSQEAVDVALGKALSAADQTAIMIEEMKYVRALITD